MVDNEFHEVYVNVEIHDGSPIANFMQFMSNTTVQLAEFPRVSARVQYYKVKQEGVETMCELLEQYAQETARETAKMLFMNGASYKLIQKSIQHLTKKNWTKYMTRLPRVVANK